MDLPARKLVVGAADGGQRFFREGRQVGGSCGNPGYGKGERAGQRSSRLSDQYRVIYEVNRRTVTVFVLEITPHKY